jgi:hypothetical protein
MLLDIPLIADLHFLRSNRQAIIDRKLFRANLSRISHEYQSNDEVLILAYKPDKLEPRATAQVHANGTVTIRRTAHVTERIYIPRIRPFRSWKIFLVRTK